MTDQMWFKIFDKWLSQPMPHDFEALILNWVIPLLGVLGLVIIAGLVTSNGSKKDLEDED